MVETGDPKLSSACSMKRNRRIVLLCTFTLFSMLILSFASVPLYRLFCQTTGFGGVPRIAITNNSSASQYSIEVRFDSNVGNGLPWTFSPHENVASVRLGETKTIFYRVRNNSDRPVTGIASFNVTPDWIAPYFNKIDCFCFTEQNIGAHETVDMPVLFFIDPALTGEEVFVRAASNLHLPAVTLSYTFFPVDSEAQDESQVRFPHLSGGMVPPLDRHFLTSILFESDSSDFWAISVKE